MSTISANCCCCSNSSNSCSGDRTPSSPPSYTTECAGGRHMIEAMHRSPIVEPDNNDNNAFSRANSDSISLASINSSPPAYDTLFPQHYDGGSSYGTFYGRAPSPGPALIDIVDAGTFFSDSDSSSSTLAHFNPYAEEGITDWGEVILIATYSLLIVLTIWFIGAVLSGDLSFWS
ncbi:hypothetical protein GGS21DRAFT_299492 [Xylaria nigripes]|nr:hypothetical protein GGS21DRAFT_299492 [Xylaria nigripes]